MSKRQQNEAKFGHWEELPNGRRRYWYEVAGSGGWKARYVKEVDSIENTVRFYQQILDNDGKLAEIHEKYPINKGHRAVREKK